MMDDRRFIPGVLYAEDFDLPDRPASEQEKASPVASPVILEPTFSLTELQRAAEHALEEGRALERRTTEAMIDTRRLDALCQIGEALRTGKAQCVEAVTVNAVATARAVLAAVAALLPALAASQALPEVRTLVELLLPAMENEPRLQIRIHPDLIAALRNDLESAAIVESITLDWVGVEAMKPGDVLVKWEGGLMVRDTRSICNQILAILLPNVSAPVAKGC
jgi:flagellar assembly protein FliH